MTQRANMSDYAKPFAMLVIADLLGVPLEHHAEFRRALGNDVVGDINESDTVAHNPLVWLDDKFREYISDRRHEPRGEVLTGLAAATYPDGAVPDVEEVVKIATILNAGIMPGLGEQRHEVEAYVDAVDVLLNGVYYTVEAALPALLDHGDGGAIVITSSAAGLNSMCPKFSVRSHGFAGYHAAKHGVVGLMRYFATSLAEKNIRVNTVHPCGVATPMILNEAVAQNMVDNPEGNSALENLLPVPMIESVDVSEQ
jgi:NAD(P)-dependent dehydrogenase (short-subunit alcohol dehydrogenase family)